MNAASIIATLGLDSRSFKAELTAVTGQVSSFGAGLAKIPNLGSLLGGFGTAAGAGLIAAEMTKVIDKAHEIHLQSERFGIDAVELQKIGNAAEADGVSLESTARGMGRLIFAEAEATKHGGKMAEAFVTLGINLDQFQKLTPGEKMLALADALKKAGLNTETYTAASELLGKRFGGELIPTLIKGSDEIKKLSEEMGIFGETTVAELDKAYEAFKKLGNTITVFVGESLARAIDSVKDIGKEFSQDVEKTKSQWSSLGDVFHKLVTGRIREGNEAAKELAKTLNFSSLFKQMLFPDLKPTAAAAAAAGKKGAISPFDPEAAAAGGKDTDEAAKVSGKTAVLRLIIAHQTEIAAALKTQLDFEEKINKAREQGLTKVVALLQVERQVTLQKQAQDIAQKNLEKLQSTLGHLAAIPQGAAGSAAGYSPSMVYAGHQARMAQEEEARAQQIASRTGRFDEAQMHLNRAEDIKGGIGQLKDSEKDLSGAVRMGLDASAIMKKIEANTAKDLVNQ